MVALPATALTIPLIRVRVRLQLAGVGVGVAREVDVLRRRPTSPSVFRSPSDRSPSTVSKRDSERFQTARRRGCTTRARAWRHRGIPHGTYTSARPDDTRAKWGHLVAVHIGTLTSASVRGGARGEANAHEYSIPLDSNVDTERMAI